MFVRFALATFTALAVISSPTQAGQVAMRATGTVNSASIGGSSPFAGQGIASGNAVDVYWEVNTPGAGASGGLENYAIDAPTFLLKITTSSGVVTRTLGAPTNVLMQNQGADGTRIFGAPLTGGTSLAFEFGDCNGLTYTSTDPLTNLVSLSGQFFCSYNFAITGSGTFIDIDPLTFSIFLPTTGTLYCFGDGTGAACPCGNNASTIAKSGCLSSLGTGGTLRATGVASTSADTISLNGTLIPNGPGLYFQGDTQLPAATPGNGVVFGDGLRCAGGFVIRLAVVTASGGASAYPRPGTDPAVSVKGLVSPGDTRHYQLWYRDSATFCSSAVFNLSNGLTLNWAP